MRNMKIKLFSLLLVLLCALPVTAAPPKGKTSGSALVIDNTTYIDANRILMFVTNQANFARDLGGYFGYDYGTFFPYTGDTTVIRNGSNKTSPLYAGGLWIGGVDSASGQTRVTISEYSSEYGPGPMENFTYMPDRPQFRVFKLYGDSLVGNPNQAYLDYLQYGIGQGAPFKVGLANDTTPDMVGDQMLWSVCNDADSTKHINASGQSLPLGVEVKQTTFAFTRQGALGNIIILKFQVFNKGTSVLQNTYFSIWADPDLGGAGDDLVGCDTGLSVGFIYNATNDDQYYGATPPSLGIDFFQGPLIYTGNPSDFALMWGDTLWNYKNMGMTSFDKYINGTDPDNFQESYNYMRGLTRQGEPYIYNGDTITYVCSGDPVTGEGDLDIAPADRRFQMSTGPITFRPGDSTEILAAIIVGQGTDRLNSITVMKQLDEFAQQLYENGFNPPKPPAKPQVTVAVLPNEITMSWTDTSEVDPGDFIFEGYSVWQGPSSAGPWTLLGTYDVINDRDVALVDSLKDLATGLVLPDIKRVVKNTGLNYHYTASEDAVRGGPLNSASDYYFRVSAFSFDYFYKGKVVPNGDRFLESQTIMKITPQAPRAGVQPQAQAHEVLAADHVGPSDGSVEPVVYDPTALTGDTYQVSFEEDTPAGNEAGIPLGVAWNLVNLTTGDTLLKNQTNQTGDSSYYVFDGLLMRILGPSLKGQSYRYTASDPLNVSQAAQDQPFYAWYTGNNRWMTGNLDNGGELMNGGIFMEPNFWGETSLGPLDYPTVELHWRPMQSWTDLNGDGGYTIGEPYVVDDPAQTQKAFMYSGFDSTTYLGYYDVPFTAWDVSNPDAPRQLNAVMRDRDKDHQWDANFKTVTPSDTLYLPNKGDLQFNYLWITTTDYDPTGTHYGNGEDGSVNFWGFDDGNGIWDAAWCLWIYQRGQGGGEGVERPILGEQCILKMVPPVLNRYVDTFTFTAPAARLVENEAALDAIKAVPNPFYLSSGYDPNPGSKQLRFHHLPAACKISIYNLGGDLIRVIDKDDPSTALAYWDLLTEQGLPVASGIYIYVVDAPGFGTKIGKVAIFTEAQVLDIF